MGQVTFAVLLWASLVLQTPVTASALASPLQQAVQPAAEPQSAQQSTEQQKEKTDDKNAIELRIRTSIDEARKSIDEAAVEKKVEQHIDRILGQVNPGEWKGPATLALLVPFGFFALVGVIIWMAFRSNQARMQARLDFHNQLLAKFSTGKEFSEFLDSEGGRRYLDELWAKHGQPKNHLLQTMGRGVMLSAIGAGFLVLTLAEEGFFIPGVIILAVGVGYLISAVMSKRLTEKLHLDETTGKPVDSDTATRG